MLATAFLSQQTLQFVILGMATGSLVALVALGVVLVHRASGVLNFSAGAVGGVGAFVFYWMRDDHEVYWLLALAVALIAGAALGVGTHLVLFFLRRASSLARLIATLGVMAIAQGMIVLLWGVDSRQPTSILPTDLVHLTDDLQISRDRLIIIIVVVVFAVILRTIYAKTMFGLDTAAVAENRVVAATSGSSPARIELINFMIAGLLSTIAAILMAPVVTLSGSVLTLTIIPALAAALFGKFSSFGLTVVAALAIGVVQAELSLFQPDIAEWLRVSPTSVTGLPQVVPLLAIVIVTVLSGRTRPARGEILAKLPLPGDGRVSPLLIALGSALALVLLFTGSAAWADAAILSLSSGVLLLSIVVLTGYGGQLSLGQFAMAGFGLWVAARLVSVADLPFEIAAVLGILATVPLGMVVALPALRTRGVNLAVVTLGLSLMINALIFNNGSLTGGFAGTVVPSPTVAGIDLDPTGHPERYGAFALICFVAAGLLVANIRRGQSGRRLLAVRSNERAAASLGVGVYGAKLFAFATAGALAGLSGILLGFRNPNIQFQQFGVVGSVTAVLSAVLGGVGWASGTVVGGLIVAGGLFSKVTDSLLGGVSNIDAWLLVGSGLTVIAMLRQSPDGLASMHSKIAQRARAHLPRRDKPQPPGPIRPRLDRVPATLEIREVTVMFGGVVALDRIGFTVRPGEIVGLMGPNGAGKTTLIDTVTGFSSPNAGQVLLGGRSIAGWSPERRARAGIARSWQAVELFDEMSVRENLLVAADRHRWTRYLADLVRPGRPRSSAVLEEVVTEFGLTPHLAARPSALPQGTARLVGIGRAIATEPSVLLLDEPAAGLTEQEARHLGREIRRVADERNLAVLLVEHDVPFLFDVADRVVVLDFGRLLAEGTPAEIAVHPEVVRAYLGTSTAEPEPAASRLDAVRVSPA